MALATNYYIIFSDPLIIAEVILACIAVLLGGSGCFIYFFYSTKFDREALIASKVHNPWESITPQEKRKTSKFGALPKPIAVLLISMAVLFLIDLIALVILLFLI